MRMGVREICEVVLRAKGTQKLGNRTFYKNEPVLYFDTLKTSSLEGAATTVYATGGRGNSRLIAWEGERTLTFNMEDALISPESFAILSGAGLINASTDTPIYVHSTQQVEVETDGQIVLKDALAAWSGNGTATAPEGYAHAGADIFCMLLDDAGQVVGEPCVPASIAHSGNNTTITCDCHEKAVKGAIVLVDFYVKHTSGAMQIDITPDEFGGYYYLEAATLFRRESDGKDLPAEFIIPRCKVQSNFTFTMAATGDPSTFSFVLDAFPDYTKFNRTKKVLACLQIVDVDSDAEDAGRAPCDGTVQGE